MDELVFLDQVGLSDKQRNVERLISVDLGDGDEGVSTAECIQEAILWCTKHDNPSTDMECDENGMGRRACVVSLGGDDHKWWKDNAWTRRGENP